MSKNSDKIWEVPGEDPNLLQKIYLSFPEHLLSPKLEFSPLDLALEYQSYRIAYRTNPTDPHKIGHVILHAQVFLK
jgi:hypothetical protein